MIWRGLVFTRQMSLSLSLFFSTTCVNSANSFSKMTLLSASVGKLSAGITLVPVRDGYLQVLRTYVAIPTKKKIEEKM